MKEKITHKNQIDIFSIANETAIEMANTSNTLNTLRPAKIKNIIKRVTTRSVLPHPEVIKRIKTYLETNDTKNRHIYNLVDFSIDITKLISSEQSPHNIIGMALSNNFLKKSIRPFGSFKEYFILFYEQVFQGNNINGSCSGYEYIDNPYDENEVLYIKTEIAQTKLKKFFENEISLEDYTIFYEIEDKKPKKNKKIDLIANIVSKNIHIPKDFDDSEKSKKLQIDIKNEIQNIFITKLDMNNFKNLIAEEKELKIFLKLYEIDRKTTMNIPIFKAIEARKRLKEIKRIKKLIHGNEIIYRRTFSEVADRQYDVLNNMSKSLRSILFNGYFEADIKNAAPSIINNNIKDEELKRLYKIFVFNKDEIIMKASRNVAKILNISTKSQGFQELKVISKEHLLSVNFGSNLNEFKKDKLSESEKLIMNELRKILKNDYEISFFILINLIVKDLGLKEKKELSHLFMKEETEAMNKLKSVFSHKYKRFEEIIHIHDALFIPKEKITPQAMIRAKIILDEYNLTIESIDEYIENSRSISSLLNKGLLLKDINEQMDVFIKYDNAIKNGVFEKINSLMDVLLGKLESNEENTKKIVKKYQAIKKRYRYISLGKSFGVNKFGHKKQIRDFHSRCS